MSNDPYISAQKYFVSGTKFNSKEYFCFYRGKNEIDCIVRVDRLVCLKCLEERK